MKQMVLILTILINVFGFTAKATEVKEFKKYFTTKEGVYGYTTIITKATTVGNSYLWIQQEEFIIEGVRYNGVNFTGTMLASQGVTFPMSSSNCYFKTKGSVRILYGNVLYGSAEFNYSGECHYGSLGKSLVEIQFSEDVKEEHNKMRKEQGIKLWEDYGYASFIDIDEVRGSDILTVFYAARDFAKEEEKKAKEEDERNSQLKVNTQNESNESAKGKEEEAKKDKPNISPGYSLEPKLSEMEQYKADFDKKIEKIDNPIEKGAYQFSYGVGEAIANKQVNTTLIEGTANMLFGFFDYLAKLRQEDLHFTGFKSKKYGCCTTYTGDFIDGKREGEGTLESSTMFYKGTFKNDKFEGNGSLKLFKVKQRNSSLTTDQVYEGYFKNGSLYNGTLNAFNGMTTNVKNGIEDTSLAGINFVNTIFFRKPEDINWKKPDGKKDGMDAWVLNVKSKDDLEYAYLNPKDGTKGIYHKINNEIAGTTIYKDGTMIKATQKSNSKGEYTTEGEYEYIFPTGDKYIGVKENDKRVGKQDYYFINGDRLYAVVDQNGFVDFKNLIYKTKNGVVSIGDIDKITLDFNQEKQVLYNLSFILFHSVLSKKQDIKEYEVPEELKNQLTSFISLGKNNSVLGLLKYEFPNIKWK
jgi:hypothetical protein